MIKSHVQQPKLILKQFCNENGELYYYSFTEDTINKGHPKTLNTKMGYYSAETESFLSRSIETPLGEAIKEVVRYHDIPHSGSSVLIRCWTTQFSDITSDLPSASFCYACWFTSSRLGLKWNSRSAAADRPCSLLFISWWTRIISVTIGSLNSPV